MTAEKYALETMEGVDLHEIEAALIGFAKIKVKEALEIAAEKIKNRGIKRNSRIPKTKL